MDGLAFETPDFFRLSNILLALASHTYGMRTMRPSFRSTLLAGGAVLILGGSAVGIAAAQSAPATPTSQPSAYQKFITALANNLHVDQGQLQSAITQSRTDAGLPAGNTFPGGGRHGGQGGKGGAMAMELHTAADFLGVQPQQLRTDLQTKSLSQLATDAHKNPADLANALKAAANTRIDQAVTAGKLTADQATQAKTRVAERIDQAMTQVMSQHANGAGPNGPGRGAQVGGGLDIAVVTGFLGVQPQQLRTDLQTKSLSQIATDAHKNPNDLANALKTAANARVDQAVTSGRLTAEQGNQRKTQVAQQIDQMMTQVLPQRGQGHVGGVEMGG
ncbi:MAG: hypothetical protein NVSMB2_28620 [Chloroflexota bacterium]